MGQTKTNYDNKDRSKFRKTQNFTKSQNNLNSSIISKAPPDKENYRRYTKNFLNKINANTKIEANNNNDHNLSRERIKNINEQRKVYLVQNQNEIVDQSNLSIEQQINSSRITNQKTQNLINQQSEEQQNNLIDLTLGSSLENKQQTPQFNEIFHHRHYSNIFPAQNLQQFNSKTLQYFDQDKLRNRSRRKTQFQMKPRQIQNDNIKHQSLINNVNQLQNQTKNNNSRLVDSLNQTLNELEDFKQALNHNEEQLNFINNQDLNNTKSILGTQKVFGVRTLNELLSGHQSLNFSAAQEQRNIRQSKCLQNLKKERDARRETKVQMIRQQNLKQEESKVMNKSQLDLTFDEQNQTNPMIRKSRFLNVSFNQNTPMEEVIHKYQEDRDNRKYIQQSLSAHRSQNILTQINQIQDQVKEFDRSREEKRSQRSFQQSPDGDISIMQHKQQQDFDFSKMTINDNSIIRNQNHSLLNISQNLQNRRSNSRVIEKIAKRQVKFANQNQFLPNSQQYQHDESFNITPFNLNISSCSQSNPRQNLTKQNTMTHIDEEISSSGDLGFFTARNSFSQMSKQRLITNLSKREIPDNSKQQQATEDLISKQTGKSRENNQLKSKVQEVIIEDDFDQNTSNKKPKENLINQLNIPMKNNPQKQNFLKNPNLEENYNQSQLKKENDSHSNKQLFPKDSIDRQTQTEDIYTNFQQYQQTKEYQLYIQNIETASNKQQKDGYYSRNPFFKLLFGDKTENNKSVKESNEQYKEISMRRYPENSNQTIDNESRSRGASNRRKWKIDKCL